MAKSMSKDQRALAKILDALDGTDAAAVRKLLRAAAIFHDVEVESIRYIPQVVDRYRPYWTLETPVWSTVRLNTSGGCETLTSGDARWQATNTLLQASGESGT